MSGDRYLLDTNAIVALLQGNSQLVKLLQNADWIGLSVISPIEFLAFSGLSQADRQLFQQFVQRVEVSDMLLHYTRRVSVGDGDTLSDLKSERGRAFSTSRSNLKT